MKWIITALILINAGWMIFDGTRALIVGDYVTPKEGRFAGQLGPWSNVVEAVGIQPRSTLMKCIFIVYGIIFLMVSALFWMNLSWAKPAIIVVAVFGLWHLPFGTLINLIVIVLVYLTSN